MIDLKRHMSVDKATGRLEGFIIVGGFDPGYGESWPKWANKHIPSNRDLFEIKLLAASKGIGRLLLAWSLYLHSASIYKAAVLEVMGGAFNTLAIHLYQ